MFAPTRTVAAAQRPPGALKLAATPQPRVREKTGRPPSQGAPNRTPSARCTQSACARLEKRASPRSKSIVSGPSRQKRMNGKRKQGAVTPGTLTQTRSIAASQRDIVSGRRTPPWQLWRKGPSRQVHRFRSRLLGMCWMLARIGLGLPLSLPTQSSRPSDRGHGVGGPDSCS